MYSDRMRTFYQHCSDNSSTASAKMKFCKDDLKFVLDIAVAAEREKEEALAEREATAKKEATQKPTTSKKTQKSA